MQFQKPTQQSKTNLFHSSKVEDRLRPIFGGRIHLLWPGIRKKFKLDTSCQSWGGGKSVGPKFTLNLF